MDLILKISAAAVLTALISLLLRRSNPEGALLLGCVTTVVVMIASLGILDGMKELRAYALQVLGAEGETLIAPILRCLVICIVSRFTADFCKDAAQHSTAAAVELAGSACCVCAVLPLLLSVLKMMGGLL